MKDQDTRVSRAWNCLTSFHNIGILPIFCWGALIWIYRNYFPKELYFFTVSLSQKFVVCILNTLILNLNQNSTKLYIFRWGARLLVKAIPTHIKSSSYAQWIPRKFVLNFDLQNVTWCDPLPNSSLSSLETLSLTVYSHYSLRPHLMQSYFIIFILYSFFLSFFDPIPTLFYTL